MSIICEILKEKDTDKCVQAILTSMHKQGVSESFQNKDILKEALLNRNSLTIIAKKGDEIKGITSGTLVPPTIGFIVITEVESFKEDLGSLLIDSFVKEIKKNVEKASFVQVTIPSSETNAVSFYSRKGFIIEGFIKKGFLVQDLIILRKYVE